MKLRIANCPGCGQIAGTSGLRICSVIVIVLTFCVTIAAASEKWQGVDESVVEKYAKEHGREAHEPLINTDKGDLLLFVFLIAGTVGGFAAGYYWRMLMSEKAPPSTVKKAR